MKKTNNKGFSLVELIIVVAIMAVLVGVLAPQYLRYLDKAKQGNDKQMCGELRTAIMTTYLDPEFTNSMTASNANIANCTGSAWVNVAKIMGQTNCSTIDDLLELEAGTITVSINSTTGAVEVQCAYSSKTDYNFTIN